MKKKAFTLVEILVVLAILATLALIIFCGLDVVRSTPDEPIETTVTDLRYEKAKHTSRIVLVNHGDHLRPQVVHHYEPEEFIVICGSISLNCRDEDSWKKIKKGDKVIVKYRKGGFTKQKFISDWVLSSDTSPEKKE